MALSDEIRSLRDRTLTELDAAHDYYEDTKLAWQLVDDVIASGRTFVLRSGATGTVTTPVDLKARTVRYVTEQLPEATFQQFISIFESFFFDFLRLWLIAYPQSLSGRRVDFKTVLEAPDRDTVVLLVVQRELNEVLYERPAAWFAYLEEKAKLGCPSADEVERIAEAKATRDVLAHNRGVAGKTYEWKAGSLARFEDGERIDISERYHREVWELFRKVASDLSDAAIAKLSRP